MKSGKRLEDNFKKSIPDNIFYYRFKDGTSAWDGGNARFQAKNICDYLLFKKQLYLIELKSHKGKSIPFSCIRDNQEKELLDARTYNIECGLIIELSDIGRVFYLDIIDYHWFKQKTSKKSIPLSLLEEKGIEIEIIKKKVNIRLNINKLLEELE